MRKLHLVGVSDDLDALIFTARRGSKSGSFLVPLTDEVMATVAELSAGRSVGPAKVRADVSDARGSSTLSPREIQARLRSGRSVTEVAREAQCSPAWVERFSAPVLAEQAQIVDLARALTYTKPRLGVSAAPLGDSVSWNLADRGVVLVADEMRSAWSSHQLPNGSWMVRLEYRSRGRAQKAQWELDLGNGKLTARNRLASELAYLEQGRRGSPSPTEEDLRRSARSDATATAKKAPTRKTAAKKTAARKAPAKKAPAKKTAAKKTPARKTAAKKAPAKKAPAKKAPAKKAPAKKTAAKKPASRRPTQRGRPAGGAGRQAPRAEGPRFGTPGSRAGGATSGARLSSGAGSRPARADLARQLGRGTGAGVAGRGVEGPTVPTGVTRGRQGTQPASARPPRSAPVKAPAATRRKPRTSPAPAAIRSDRRRNADDGEPTQAMPAVSVDDADGPDGKVKRSASDDAFLAFLSRTTAKLEAERRAREAPAPPAPEEPAKPDENRYLGELDPMLEEPAREDVAASASEWDESEWDESDRDEQEHEPALSVDEAPTPAEGVPAVAEAEADDMASEPPPEAGYWAGEAQAAGAATGTDDADDAEASSQPEPPAPGRRREARSRFRRRRRNEGAVSEPDPLGPGHDEDLHRTFWGEGSDDRPVIAGQQAGDRDGAAAAPAAGDTSPGTGVRGWRARRGITRD